MNFKDEEVYRKWLGICQQTKTVPLIMRFVGNNVHISTADKPLLTISKRKFLKLTANKLIEKMGVPTK